MDVIESVNLLVSKTGHVLQSEIVGSVKMKVHLTGMPELRLGLNDKVLFENTGSKSQWCDLFGGLNLKLFLLPSLQGLAVKQ